MEIRLKAERVMWGRPMSSKQKIKTAIDLAAVFFILYFAHCGVWAYYHPEPIGERLPIQIVFLIFDVIPFVFGLCWFLYKGNDAINRNFPIVKNKWFGVLWVGAGMAITILAETFWI
jgi:hypothetical protein